MKVENLAKYELFIIVGVLMAGLVLGKLLGFYDISSDWFWFIVAIGLVVEGTISMIKQRKFDRKYKIVERVKQIYEW